MRAISLTAAALAAAVALSGGRGAALVIPPPSTPEPDQHAVTPAPEPTLGNASALPLNSSLFFVLDDPISSRTSSRGTFARAHLRDAMVVAGETIAPAGTPVQIEILKSDRAKMGNVDGSVDIYFEPLVLPSGVKLPLRTPTEHIDAHLAAGRAYTRGVTDTIGDIFIPYHVAYRMLRKGIELDLRPGTVVRARTAAIVGSRAGRVVIATPPPFDLNVDKPAPNFPLHELAEPVGVPPIPTKHPKPATPSPVATATP